MKNIFSNRNLVFLALSIPFLFSNGFSQDFNWGPALKTNLEKLADSLTLNVKPWAIPNSVFNVEDFGAKGDGTTLNTVSIQAAIDSCSSKGGGIVLFDSGNYLTGTIRLKSNVMLEVSEGAKILGSTNLADYPAIKENLKSIMSEYYQKDQSLIYAEKVSNIGIRGKGEIYFRGEKINFPGQQTIGPMPGRPFGIRVFECSNIFLKNITLRNAAAWMQNYVFSNNLIFDSITVWNDANVNNDGLDIDGCNGVIVKNSTIIAEDDALCFKGASAKPTQNVLVENCKIYSSTNAFKIGTDTQGPFKNFIARNCILGGVPPGTKWMGKDFQKLGNASTGITLATVDGGDVENIYLSGMEINYARCPIFLRIGNRGRVIAGVPKPPVGYLKNILIENITGSNNLIQGSFISGISGHLVSDVIIRNYKVSMAGGGTSAMTTATVPEKEGGYPDAQEFNMQGLPAYGFYLRYASNIWFDSVKTTPVKADARPQFASGVDTLNIVENGKAFTTGAIVKKSKTEFFDAKNFGLKIYEKLPSFISRSTKIRSTVIGTQQISVTIYEVSGKKVMTKLEPIPLPND